MIGDNSLLVSAEPLDFFFLKKEAIIPLKQSSL